MFKVFILELRGSNCYHNHKLEIPKNATSSTDLQGQLTCLLNLPQYLGDNIKWLIGRVVLHSNLLQYLGDNIKW